MLGTVTRYFFLLFVAETFGQLDGDGNFHFVPEKNTTSEYYDDFATRTLSYVNVSQHSGEHCNRICKPNQYRVCYFQFTLEHYHAMGPACGRCMKGIVEDCNNVQCIVGDGVEKGVMSINRKIPGPAIQVCKGDFIIVDVVNNAHGTAAAIHWHGLHMKDTPFMDGVPYTTQCPIPFASTFRYSFTATEAGTHFYHSHSGHHKINGQYGALIVREPYFENAHSSEYDFDLPEHHILISDWMHDYGEQLFPGLQSASGIFPDSLLINGRGTYINPETMDHTKVPVTKYFVKAGHKYRFRIINSVSHACPVQLQIEGHSLTIISTDSYNVESRSFDTLISNSGERYDFILTANYTKGDFWIKACGLGVCSIKPTETFAILSYETNKVNQTESSQPDFPAYNKTFPPGRYLNHPNASCFEGNGDHCVTELNAIEIDKELLTKKPDHKFFLAFHNFPVPNNEIFKAGSYQHFSNLQNNLTIVGAVNNLSLVFPASPPLTQPKDIDESQYCDEFHWPKHCIGKRLCACIHRIVIRKDSIVELIIVDESTAVGRMHHPFHLHGYRFMVTALGHHPFGLPMTVDRAIKMEMRSELPRNYQNDRPPFKDTVSIPSCGYAVVKFRANNPGYWLMHCHYEWHLAIGMGLILQVGKQHHMTMPPKDFPQCKNYVPDLRLPRKFTFGN